MTANPKPDKTPAFLKRRPLKCPMRGDKVCQSVNCAWYHSKEGVCSITSIATALRQIAEDAADVAMRLTTEERG